MKVLNKLLEKNHVIKNAINGEKLSIYFEGKYELNAFYMKIYEQNRKTNYSYKLSDSYLED